MAAHMALFKGQPDFQARPTRTACQAQPGTVSGPVPAQRNYKLLVLRHRQQYVILAPPMLAAADSTIHL